MIGIYAICYKDADWLCWNLQRMYGWVEQISVCVGPVKRLLGAEEDTESVDALAAMPDPDKKLTVISGVWKDKNEMTAAALSNLQQAKIIQLDADEVWPRAAFDEAVRLLDTSHKVKAHMYTFWKSPDYILETPDATQWLADQIKVRPQILEDIRAGLKGGQDALRREFRKLDGIAPTRDILYRRVHATQLYFSRPDVLQSMLTGPWTPWLLDMHRAFRPTRHASIRHIPPDLVWPNGEIAERQAGPTMSTPLWHFSYVGAERYARKADFFAKRGDGTMPSPEEFRGWTDQQLHGEMKMTGQRRRVVKYAGPPIPEDVKEFVRGQA
jgi:hypothetical protein